MEIKKQNKFNFKKDDSFDWHGEAHTHTAVAKTHVWEKQIWYGDKETDLFIFLYV